MSKTLLAVDDSATMRKVLDITFSGEDFRVVGAETRDAALAKLSEGPNVVVLDISLGSDDAYALAKEIRQRAPAATLVLMASRYNPYDANKGRDAGVDDFVDKPFDTQQMIDKVKKAMLAREAGGAAAAPAVGKPAAAAAMGPSGTVPSIQSPFQSGGTRPTGAGAPPPPAPPPAARPAPPPPVAAASTSRTHTLSFENSPFAAPAAPPKAAPAAAPPPPPPPAAAAPHHSPPPPAAAAPAAPRTDHVANAVNGQLAGKLGELGLSPAQAEAVLALSREVVERVVWEVVPQLAETIIKEEIARLTKAG